jgi:hypothetical protein
MWPQMSHVALWPDMSDGSPLNVRQSQRFEALRMSKLESS